MTLVMYMKPGCPWCEEQRERFRAQGIEWEEIDAKADPAARADLIRYTDGTRRCRPWSRTGGSSPSASTATVDTS